MDIVGPAILDLLAFTGWHRDDVLDLDPDFRLPLLQAVSDAKSLGGLTVRRRSGWRSNEQQQALRDAYEEHLKAYNEGREHVPPLPASCPGHSAHNHTECVTDRSHVFGTGTACQVCGGEAVGASAACDVEILDHNGNPIPSGGALPVEQRPRQWQLWAQVVERHNKLRDGGTFKKPDPVHVEDVRWNDTDFALTGTYPAEPEAPAPAPVAPKAKKSKPKAVEA